MLLKRLQGFQWRPLMRLYSSELVHKDSFIENLRKNFKEDELSGVVVPTFKKAMLYPDDIAIKDISGSASQMNVIFLCSNNALWIVMQWACWISGQVAVPLEPNHAIDELLGQATDCKAHLVIGTPDSETITQELAQKLQSASIVVDHSFVPTKESISSTAMYARQLVGRDNDLIPESMLPNDYYNNAPAMLLYTPSSSYCRNGVILTYRNIEAQMDCLTASWQLNASDSMLPIISMNRMHAAIGALLGVGGNIVLHQKFESHIAWRSLLDINSPSKQRVNIFLAMPIVFKRLITEYEKMFAQDSRMVEYIINHCKHKIRLMATGFGLLPETVFYRWRDLTGHNIYEYYGLLETGLVLGPVLGKQTLSDNANYYPGTLGAPLVGVTARLVNSQGEQLVSSTSSKSEAKSSVDPVLPGSVVGELEIAGVHLYPLRVSTNQPLLEQTTNQFIKTGDICAYQSGCFHFLSKSTDVFNVGGYKIYGSEIKKALISHPGINDVAVLGIPNKLWGHRLGVICILSPDSKIDVETIKTYCYSQLPSHKRPTIFKTIVAK
ncbi:GH24264 [Drosophila grimshawi]|uniref:GH24264 n=1 Tax=Drosophila grimshawi TaxID=7222 RepID=B4JMV1_DROGR|nr:GH24264 [Drosophila grimshawi]